MKPTLAFLGMTTLLSVLTAASDIAAPDKTPHNAAEKVKYLVAGTDAHGKPSTPLTVTIWETQHGERVEFSDSDESHVLLLPNDMNIIYALDAKTKQAQAIVQADCPFPMPTASDTEGLNHVKILAPTNFLGYHCKVAEASHAMAGNPGHVQVWAAIIDGRPALLRYLWHGDNGSTFLMEAVNVERYKQAPAGLLHIPAGYAITPLQTARAAP